LNYSDVGLILEAVGFLFAFGTFRVLFYMLYEVLRREYIFYLYTKEMKTDPEYMKIKSSLKNIKDIWKFNMKNADDFRIAYNEAHLNKLTKGGEEHWPALKNILKLVGWALITIGLSFQHSYFNPHPPTIIFNF
jgi:hypothetical protein